MSDSVWPHGLQNARPPCPSPTPRVYSNSCPSSRWCHPTISSSVIPFSSRLLSFPASGSFPVSWLFASGGQSIETSISVLPVNIKDWFPLGFTGLTSLQINNQLQFKKEKKQNFHQDLAFAQMSSLVNSWKLILHPFFCVLVPSHLLK